MLFRSETTMKRLHKITLKPRKDDALYVMQGLAMQTCVEHRCDVEFTFQDRLFLTLYSDMCKTCKEVKQ